MNNGWIKLHEKFLKWEWYKKPNMVALFIHLILKANWKPGRFEGKIIGRGQLATSLKSLSRQTGISVQSIRTCLKHLKSTGEVTDESTGHYRIITVCNYEAYQEKKETLNNESNREPNSDLTRNQQGPNNNRRDIRSKDKEKENKIKEKESPENKKPKQKSVLQIERENQAFEIREYWNDLRRENYGLNIEDNKDQTIKNIVGRLKEHTYDQLLRCVDRQFMEWGVLGKDPQYLYKISNFFGRAAYYEAFISDDWKPSRPRKPFVAEPETSMADEYQEVTLD